MELLLKTKKIEAFNAFFSWQRSFIKFWFALFCIQFCAAFICAIIGSSVYPDHSTWLLEFLSLPIGLPNDDAFPYHIMAWIFLAIHSLTVLVDFVKCRDLMIMIRKFEGVDPNSIHLMVMKRRLKTVMVCIILSLFAQMIYGIIWWVIAAFVLFMKVLFIKRTLFFHDMLCDKLSITSLHMDIGD